MRLKLLVEYAGTRYSGWQIQKNARTVQGEIETAIGKVSGRKDFELYGSGRTDAGVHALGQVAHLDLQTAMAADDLVARINAELPADINVLAAVKVPHRFHARHDAVARSYVYQVARRRTAFAKPYVWWVKDPLALDAMREAAAHFAGMQDFQSFTDADPGLEVAVDQAQQSRFGHVALQPRNQPVVIHPVKECLQIKVDHPAPPLPDIRL